jgi:hypothetical protein
LRVEDTGRRSNDGNKGEQVKLSHNKIQLGNHRATKKPLFPRENAHESARLGTS